MRKSFLIWMSGISTISLILAMVGTGTSILAARASSGAMPPAADAVPNGTHFLVRLDDELDTGKDKVKKRFDAKTVEPLETSNGYIVAPGAKIRGHISRIEPAGSTGRARLWLTFDDIQTNRGRLPIVAVVSSVPGDFSVRPGESRQGEIEARSGSSKQEIEAVAVGAVIGAVPGATAHDAKAAAKGAAAGGVSAFVATSGLGKELDLPKGTKIDLVLDRPLYLEQ